MTNRLNRWRRHPLALVGLAAAMFALTACDGTTPAATAGGDELAASTPPPDTVVVATPNAIRNVNELTAEISMTHQAIHNFALFRTLLREMDDYEERPAGFEPLVAKSYEFSADRKVLTFELRDDVFWSDGEPLTAEDVRWTWQAQTHPAVGWVLADQKRFITDVEVVDPYTVRFHFDKVYAVQLLDANLGVILPRHAWSRLPFEQWRTQSDWFLQPENLVVSGPFTVERWDPGERFILKRNERYSIDPETPRVERIVFRVVPDRAAQLALLRSGEAHLVAWARPADAAELEDDPDIRVLSYIPRGPNVLIWNMANPLFASKAVRQALTLAIDRQGIIDTLYYGYANVTDSLYTSNLWTSNKQLRPWPYDPERARELLASEGWTDTDGDGVVDRGGRPFSFQILTTTGNELREDILVMVQDQLARVGVKAGQQVVEFNSLLARSRSHDFEAVVNGLGIPTNLDLSDFLHSSAIDDGYNMSSYSNPEVDRVLEQIKAHVDQLEAKPLYDRLQVLLQEDVPMTVLYEPWRLVPVRKELVGVHPNAVNTYYELEKWALRKDGEDS